jgi:hypothetical protein
VIKLSKRQAVDADRTAGIELIVLWTPVLGPEPTMEQDTERDANDEERRYAIAMLRDECVRLDLLVRHVRIASLKRPDPFAVAPGEVRAHLGIHIIARRNRDVSRAERGELRFAQ